VNGYPSTKAGNYLQQLPLLISNKAKDKAAFNANNSSFGADNGSFSDLARDFPPPVWLSKKAIRLWFGILENWSLTDQCGLGDPREPLQDTGPHRQSAAHSGMKRGHGSARQK
jgi:hypothetical protein